MTETAHAQTLLAPVTARAPRPSQFLASWFSTCPPDQFLELRAIRLSDRHVHQEFFAVNATGELVGTAFSLVEGYHVYFGVCPRIRPRGDKDSVTHAPDLWADLDFKRFQDGEAGALRKLAEFPLPPTWMVATCGGFHLYWHLRRGPCGCRIRGTTQGHCAGPRRRPRGNRPEPRPADPRNIQPQIP